MTSLAPDLFDRVVRRCSGRGMNLVGAVDAAAFDAAQPRGRRARERMPSCETIVLLGSGGRAAWDGYARERGLASGAARSGPRGIDAWTASVAVEVVQLLREAGFAASVLRPEARRTMNFRQLGEAVGFGTISPVIGHLLHPEFGPWVSLRAAILVAGRPFGPAEPAAPGDFEPCFGCAQPCVRACPAGVYGDRVPFDLEGCARWSVAGGCASDCATLRACPIGAEHRYGPEEEALWRDAAMSGVRRWLGAGPWRLVPAFLRRRS